VVDEGKRNMQLKYPAILKKDDNGTWLVTFPDFDDAVTFGETRQEARAQAIDALETAILFRLKQELDIPVPSAGRGQ
jgi:antitoxin HicB